MNPEVERIFDEVADLTQPARERYFADRQIEDGVRREVESLLAHDQLSAATLMTPILDLAASAAGALPRCGAYELKQLIGSGGMGSVYRAERVDGEIRQQVAVKLMQMSVAADPLQRQRFLQERQILAGLQHPNIATLLDAGHAEGGQPYFVLELVRGVRIDQYSNALTVRQKVELFLNVCDAVAFAHSRLVIHRDLKPGNILVTEDGVPKLLDFGIAKMLDQEGDETVTWARALTPSYGSPEQVTGAGVTTATDVYSLGAVLYKMLTGRPPHALENASPEEVLNAICLRDVTRPSRTNPELGGDLEAILMKALRKEPEQRYQTVEQLSEDLRRYLQVQPIRARQGEFFYRASKYVRRYWLPLTAAAVAIAALAGGLVIASRERQRAEQRFSTARRLASNLFEVENRVRLLQGSTETRAYIADSALKYLNELSATASERDLLLELGEAYERTASILSSRRVSSLGRDADAMTALNHGDELLQRALKANPDDRSALRLLVRNRSEMLLLVTDLDRGKGWQELVAELSRTVEKLGNTENATAADLNLASTAYAGVRRTLTTLHRVKEAERYALLAVDYSRRYAERSQSPDGFLQYAGALRGYGNLLRVQGQIKEAQVALQDAAQALEKVPDGKPRQKEMSAVLYYLGMVNGDQWGLGDRKAAISALEQSAHLSQQLMAADAKDHNVRVDYVQSAHDLAQMLEETDPRRALQMYDDAWKVMEREPAGSFLRTEYMVRLSAASTFALRKLGRNAEAGERLKRIGELFPEYRNLESVPTGPTAPAESISRAEAELEAALGRPRKAIAIYSRLLERFAALKGFRPRENLIDAVALSEKQARLREFSKQAGDAAMSAKYAAQRQELWQYWNQKLPGNPYISQQLAAASR